MTSGCRTNACRGQTGIDLAFVQSLDATSNLLPRQIRCPLTGNLLGQSRCPLWPIRVHPTWRRCWPRSGHCAAMRHTARAIFILDGAGRGNRTHTLLPEPDFESGASTSSAIPAFFMNQLLTWETCLPVDVLDPRPDHAPRAAASGTP